MPLAHSFKRIITKYWHLVEAFVGSSLPRVGYKKLPSIRNKIIRADPFQRMKINLKGYFKCHVCAQTIEGASFTIPDMVYHQHETIY